MGNEVFVIHSKEKYPLLSFFRFANMQSSSADLERNFSTLAHIYGKNRVRLGAEKAGKLCFLYTALRKNQDAKEDNEEENI